MTTKADTHQLLERFQTLWNESLNGYYKNGVELKNIALKLNAENTKGNISANDLKFTELQSLKHALIIANV